jgi:hypothetical protein
LPSKLERQVALFDGEPELGLVHCGVEEVDRGGRSLRTRLAGMEGWVAREMLFFQRDVILGGGSATVIPREIFECSGGFDERLSTSADWDLYYRVARRHRVGFIPEALVRYRIHPGNMHGNVHAMARDMLRAYAKVFDGADPDVLSVARRAYGRLHAMIAASFFQARDYREFARHALLSVMSRPCEVGYFAAYPARVLGRRLSDPGDG